MAAGCMAVSFIVASRSSLGRADDDRVCFESAAEGQRLERAGKLTEARASFVACAQKSCPTEVVSHCEEWLRDVTNTIPSVVLVGQDAKGRDVTDAATTIDGVPVRNAFSGTALSLDPGPHRLHFVRPGSAPVDLTLVARVHEKERRVDVVFRDLEAPVPAAAWVLGSVGIVGLGLFAGFGIYGVTQRASLGCDVGCSSDSYSQVRREFVTADVSLGVGLISLAGATWVFLARSHKPPEESARLGLSPVVAGRSAGFAFRF
jgi:hypothetical protein